ncbi:TPA: hypothetical protein U2R15_004164 [Klebsiella aerogenes]|nr:hypothetical protein [Klebsiella aerogenes]
MMTMFKKTLAALLVIATTGTVAYAGHSLAGNGTTASVEVSLGADASLSHNLTPTDSLAAGTVVDNQVLANGTVSSASGEAQKYEVSFVSGYIKTMTLQGKEVRVAAFSAQDNPNNTLGVALVSDDMDTSLAVNSSGTVINASTAAPEARYSLVTADISGNDAQKVDPGTFLIKTTASAWIE